MKTKITLLTLFFCLSFSAATYAQGFWDRLSDVVTGIVNVCNATGISDVAGAYVVGKTADMYEKNGYSKEEAQKNASLIGEALGVSKANTDNGIAWNNASNRYQKN